MTAGKYRVPITMQRPVDVTEPGGAVTRSFEDVGTSFAALRLRGQSERFGEEQLLGRRIYELRLRPFSGLQGGWRIVSGQRVFRVLSVGDPYLKNREWLCEVEEEGP